ncbi:MAG: hypothetical protein JSU94_12360 [Phycisphaerales bacterium]|nr:MAG: hypothetical protein JSU94_12360 [Phycisphaerales bacterium]
MKRAFKKGFVLGVGALLLLIAGCQEQQLPSEKQSRLIAAENIRLRKQLGQRADEIEMLKELHNEQMTLQQSQLGECKEEQKVLRDKLEQGTRKEVQEVLQAVMEESAAMRAENEKLKARVEQLEAELKKTE